MTQNQINYAKVREEQRHNLATEGYSAIELSEAQRHNIAGEQENVRHNLASENINWYNAGESKRHNVQTEGLNWYLAPSQVGQREAQAEYYHEQAENVDPRFSLDTMKYELEKKIADMDWYKIYWNIENDKDRIKVAKQEADTAAQRVTEQVNEWLRRYGFDTDRYYKSGRAKEISETVRNYVASGKDATSIVNAIMDIIGNIQNNRKRNDLIPDEWQTFYTN